MARDPEKQRQSFRNWYDVNRDALSVRRQEKYRSDPSYREAAISRSRMYRQQKGGGKRIQQIEHNGQTITVYSVGFVAEKIGRTTQVLRLWESKNMIPKATYGGVHRFYDANQVKLLIKLADTINAKEGDRTVAHAITYLKNNWEQQ